MIKFTGKTALIIEDDETSIKVMMQLLKQVDMTATVIKDSYDMGSQLGQVAVPDVVFLDLEMPQANGYSVLEYIQQTPQFANTPVVAYTTHTSHLNVAKNAGFHSFLGKPIDGKRFPVLLEKILNGEPVWEVPS
ncbi:MAG: response regulator [Anaerolineae bacterium]|jgi:CheY-like chemotaxis protein|nr:response regulator [Anaerolineae bacterium]